MLRKDSSRLREGSTETPGSPGEAREGPEKEFPEFPGSFPGFPGIPGFPGFGILVHTHRGTRPDDAAPVIFIENYTLF